jgi:hypothetical protein
MVAGRQWPIPVILATWEAEIGRIAVPDKSQKRSLRDPPLNGKNWVWWIPIIPEMVGSIK